MASVHLEILPLILNTLDMNSGSSLNSSRAKSIFVDARMWHHSGIGVVLRHTAPLLVQQFPHLNWTFLFPPQSQTDLSPFDTIPTSRSSSLRFLFSSTPIYSLREQLSVFPHFSNSLFWSPHYNIPLFYSGNLITTIHDCCHLALPHIFRGISKKSYARFMFSQATKKSAKIVCVSQFTADELQKYTSVSPDKITVIPNGVDPKWSLNFSNSSSSESPHSKPYLLYYGNVKPHKNINLLLTAFQSLLSEFEHDLIIVGERKNFITPDASIHHQDTFSKRILFTGYLESSQLAPYIYHATGLCFPSLYEGFGLGPLEGMAAGIPMAISDIPAHREVCGTIPLYFNPTSVSEITQALKQLLSLSKTEKDKMLKEGKDRASLFTWEKSVFALRKLFQELTI